jgi:hypothetical protein
LSLRHEPAASTGTLARDYTGRYQRSASKIANEDQSLNTGTEYHKENVMSAPSRRPEIRRRRTRAEKVAKLRKRLAAASASTDKDRLTDKLHRVGLVSPGNPLVKSE